MYVLYNWKNGSTHFRKNSLVMCCFKLKQIYIAYILKNIILKNILNNKNILSLYLIKYCKDISVIDLTAICLILTFYQLIILRCYWYC